METTVDIALPTRRVGCLINSSAVNEDATDRNSENLITLTETSEKLREQIT